MPSKSAESSPNKEFAQIAEALRALFQTDTFVPPGLSRYIRDKEPAAQSCSLFNIFNSNKKRYYQARKFSDALDETYENFGTVATRLSELAKAKTAPTCIACYRALASLPDTEKLVAALKAYYGAKKPTHLQKQTVEDAIYNLAKNYYLGLVNLYTEFHFTAFNSSRVLREHMQKTLSALFVKLNPRLGQLLLDGLKRNAHIRGVHRVSITSDLLFPVNRETLKVASRLQAYYGDFIKQLQTDLCFEAAIAPKESDGHDSVLSGRTDGRFRNRRCHRSGVGSSRKL